MKKLIDANLLIYALIEDHPASSVCEAFIRKENRYRKLYTTMLTPFEVFHVLWRIYGLKREQAMEKALSLFNSPLSFIPITEEVARISLEKIVEYKIDSNDALLLTSSILYDIPSLASDDRKLLKASNEEGIHTQSPINEKLRRDMNEWEKEKLASKGIPRILQRIYKWLLDIDNEIAEEFKKATNNLKQLP
nr:type II toxin-antitoxin system VapC family toxin [Candidatus Baldrarchaeota archaeon]